jgi:hypothetical protein
VQDDPRSGQPKTQRPDANMDRVRTFVRSDRRSGVRLTAEELNMNSETTLFGEEDPNSDLRRRFPTMTITCSIYFQLYYFIILYYIIIPVPISVRG